MVRGALHTAVRLPSAGMGTQEPPYAPHLYYLPKGGDTAFPGLCDQALSELGKLVVQADGTTGTVCGAPFCVPCALSDPAAVVALRNLVVVTLDEDGANLCEATKAHIVKHVPAPPRRVNARIVRARASAPTDGSGAETDDEDGEAGSGAQACVCRGCLRSCTCSGSYGTSFGTSYDYTDDDDEDAYSEWGSEAAPSVTSSDDDSHDVGEDVGTDAPAGPSRTEKRAAGGGTKRGAAATSSSGGSEDGGDDGDDDDEDEDDGRNQFVAYRGATVKEVLTIYAELIKKAATADTHLLRYMVLWLVAYVPRMEALLVRGCCRTVFGDGSQRQFVSAFSRMVQMHVRNTEALMLKPDAALRAVRMVGETAVQVYADGDASVALEFTAILPDNSHTDIHTLSATGPIHPWPVNVEHATFVPFTASQLAGMSDGARAAMPTSHDYTGTEYANQEQRL